MRGISENSLSIREFVTHVSGIPEIIEKARRDVGYLNRLSADIRKPRPRIDSAINAFLDAMRFEITELGLTELRNQTPVRRLSIEERIREMNDD